MSKRDEYVAKLKTQIDEWNVQVDKLEARAKQLSASARIGYDEQVKALYQQREVAKAKLAEIQAASDGAWEDLRHGVDGAWTAFRDALEKAASRYK